MLSATFLYFRIEEECSKYMGSSSLTDKLNYMHNLSVVNSRKLSILSGNLHTCILKCTDKKKNWCQQQVLKVFIISFQHLNQQFSNFFRDNASRLSGHIHSIFLPLPLPFPPHLKLILYAASFSLTNTTPPLPRSSHFTRGWYCPLEKH